MGSFDFHFNIPNIPPSHKIYLSQIIPQICLTRNPVVVAVMRAEP